MKSRIRALALVAVAACILAAGGCATRPVNAPEAAAPAANSVLRSLALDRALEDRILALDPERITEDDVRTTLAAAPAPRIILLHGGIYPVYLAMVSFGRFLIGMGYPDAKIRDPGDRRWSYSPYEDSAQIAGLVAWDYERDGVRPMLIGHSQGGIQAVKILRELDGAFSDRIAVWNPITRHRGGPHVDRRPADGRRAAGGRAVGVLCVERRRRRRRAPAAQPVEHGRPPAHDSRHRRRIHRLFDRARPHGLDGSRGGSGDTGTTAAPRSATSRCPRGTTT